MKIKDCSFFAEDYYCGVSEDILKKHRKGNYLIPKRFKVDFDSFTKKYGFEIPEIIKEYYSYCHPFVSGQHKNSPYQTEGIVLYSALRSDFLLFSY